MFDVIVLMRDSTLRVNRLRLKPSTVFKLYQLGAFKFIRATTGMPRYDVFGATTKGLGISTVMTHLNIAPAYTRARRRRPQVQDIIFLSKAMHRHHVV
jgi:hypothetical protein